MPCDNFDCAAKLASLANIEEEAQLLQRREQAMSHKEYELAELAEEQWGLVTTGQARLAGVSPQVMAKMVGTGDLVRLVHGVYRLAGAPIHEQEELRAVWLRMDPTRTAGERIAESAVDVVSHRSAARLRGLGDLAADVMEFTVPRRRQTRRGDVRLYRGAVTGRDWTLVDGLPVATALRTIDDLARERIDQGHLAGVVGDALARDLVLEDELVRVLARHARGYGLRTGNGRGLLRELLRQAGQRATLAEAWFHGIDPEVLRRIMPSPEKILAAMPPEMKERIADSLGDAVRNMAPSFRAATDAAAGEPARKTEPDAHR